MLNRNVLRKTSGLLAVVLLVSMLMPVLAFAKIEFKGVVRYDKVNKVVTGSVYSDTYSVKDSVYIDVYGPGINPFIKRAINQIVYTGYSASDNTYRWNFSISVEEDTYYSLCLKAWYGSDKATTEAVYDYPRGCTTYGGGGGGFGGGSGTVDGKIEVGNNGTVNTDELAAELEKNKGVTITVKDDTVSIPAKALLKAQEGATLTIVTDNGTYILPVSVLKLEELAKSLGAKAKDVNIKVGIKKLSGDAAKAVEDAAKKLGLSLNSAAVDFKLSAEANGKSVAIDDFDKTYVKRKLALNAAAAKNTTIALYDSAAKKLSFVPSTFKDKEATFQRTGNSVYVAVHGEVSFDDVDDHWAQATIEELASKLIVEGTGNDMFEPDRSITRAEFAALVTRALGLNTSVTGNNNFSDVESGDWYAGVVLAAKNAGLVDGYEDGTFKPNKEINREELAALVVRALKFAGVKADASSSDIAALKSKFDDADEIVWAEAELAATVKLGIVEGRTDTTLVPSDDATRAEAATMLKRLLTKAGFAN